MRLHFLLILFLARIVVLAADMPGVVINQSRLARIRAAKMHGFEQALQFDNPQADAILSALEVFPPDNAWNIPVDAWPVAPNSAEMIAATGGDKPLRCNPDMGLVLVPPTQTKVNVRLTAYDSESDKGPFPVPDNAITEGWPAYFKREPIRSRNGVMRYCSKNYMGKEFALPEGWEKVGRFWGVVGRKNLPRSQVMEVEISREAFVRVRRTARSWFASKGMIRRGGGALTLYTAAHLQWARVIDWAETGHCQPIDFAALLTRQPF